MMFSGHKSASADHSDAYSYYHQPLREKKRPCQESQYRWLLGL